MKRLFSAAAAALCAAVCLSAPAQTTPVTASVLKMRGVPIANGTVTITPSNQIGQPIPIFAADGSQQGGAAGYSTAITNGAVSGYSVPDQALSFALVANTPLYYQVLIVNAATKESYSYLLPPSTVTGSNAFALDQYHPMQGPVASSTTLSTPTLTCNGALAIPFPSTRLDSMLGINATGNCALSFTQVPPSGMGGILHVYLLPTAYAVTLPAASNSLVYTGSAPTMPTGTTWGGYQASAFNGTVFVNSSFNPGTGAGGGTTTTPPPAPVSSAAVFPSGLPVGMFGSNFALNQPIDQLPVDTRSIATGYGAGLSVTSTGTVNQQVQTGSPEGSSTFGLVVTGSIPVTVVNSAQHPELLVNVTYTPDGYIDESDSIDPTYTPPSGQQPRTRLMPVNTCVIEGENIPSADHHCIVPDLATMLDYELYKVTRATDGSLTAQQVTVWNIKTGQRVSDSGCNAKPCTSADAAGLPILPALVRYEEIQWALDHNLPDIGHAIRVTYNWTRQGAGGSAGWFIPPATHAAGNGGGPVVEGMRMRVPASLAAPTGLSAADTIIWNTLAKYGDVVADNGGTGYLIPDADPRWNGDHNLSLPTGVYAAGMEVVNNGCWINADGTKDNTGILGAGCQ